MYRSKSLDYKTRITRTEFEIWQYLIDKGGTQKDIAEHFNISPKTVSTHLYNLSKKVGVHNVGSLIILGWKNKLANLGESEKVFDIFNMKAEIIALQYAVDTLLAKYNTYIEANEKNAVRQS